MSGMDFPSAAISAPPIQYPDLIGSYLRGQMGGQQSQAGAAQLAMIPGQMQEQQNALAQQGLTLDQLRMTMQLQQMRQQALQGAYGAIGGGSAGGAPAAAAGTAGAGAQSGASSSGGIQSGPQGSVSAQAPLSYDPNNPLAYLLDPRRLAANAQIGSINAAFGGQDPNKPVADALKLQDDARESAIKKAQLQAEIPSPDNPMPLLKSIAGMTPEHAAATLSNNPGLLPAWTSVAKKYGVDPFDKTQIPVVAAMEYNRRGAPIQLNVPVPAQIKNVNLGQGEVAQIDQTGKKVGDLIERQTPSFTLTDVWDPTTNQTRKVPVQTGGYGMQGVGPTGNVVSNSPAAQFPASAQSLGFNTGFKAPSDPELKAAMFGSEMRSGLQTLNQLEGKGFALNPAQRAAFISAASSEDPGAVHQFLSQEYLAHQSPETQTYMTALMPLLQATGHDQSGARVTTAQIRQNLESTIPLSATPSVLSQINKNRQGFYTGLLGQAGSATQLPQYKNTIGADLKTAQAPAQAPAAAVEHLKQHPELAPAFRAKYGYVPQ